MYSNIVKFLLAFKTQNKNVLMTIFKVLRYKIFKIYEV